MKFVVIILIAIVVGVVLLLWQHGRRLSMSYDQSAGALVPDPIAISNDDPLMKEATDRARATVGTVRELLPSRPQNCYVKIPFQTSSGAVEHVWAGLISLNDKDITCQILSRPVHHQGDIPSPYYCSASALEDWQVLMPDDTIRGGYTMRVMFQRAKERYGDRMPKDLAVEMQRYVDR